MVNEQQQSMAVGGPPPMGAQAGLLEIDFGRGGRYDPGRDILNFWRYMVAAVVSTMRDRTIPILKEFDGNPELERRVTMTYKAFIDAHQVRITTYDQFIDAWKKLQNPIDYEAMDIIMKIFGRAVMQFYMECVLVRGVPEDQVWPLGMDHMIRGIIGDRPAPESCEPEWVWPKSETPG
jgi:hypothetical protein